MPRIAPSADWISNSMNLPRVISDEDLLHHSDDEHLNLPASSPVFTRKHPIHGLARRRSDDGDQYLQTGIFSSSPPDPEEIRESTLQLSSMVIPSKLHDQFTPTKRSNSGMSPAGISSLGRSTIQSASYKDSYPISESADRLGLDLGDDAQESSKTTSRQETSSSGVLQISSGSPPSLPNLATVRQHQPSGIAIQLARARATQLDSVPFISIQQASQDEVPDLNQLESQRRATSTPIREYSYDDAIPVETTSLLPSTSRTPQAPTYSSTSNHGSALFPDPPPSPSIGSKLLGAFAQTQKLKRKEVWKDMSTQLISSIPAVIIGLLLNILDGVSYGMIIFPVSGIFADFGSLGVSMFFLTTAISQLIYSAGTSAFAAANGSMMIEVVPFFVIIIQEITKHVGEDNPKVIIATTMVAFAFSSILTGLAFLLLGALKLGALIGFFPRHILVGCIGGIGWFLIETGFEVAAGLSEGGFKYSIPMFRLLFLDAHVLSLWLPAIGLAVLLKLITMRFQHQLIFPMYFLSIPIFFYIIVAIVRVDMTSLRHSGWVFDIGDSEPWWKFYTYFNFKITSWSALWITMPTQLALLFFNVLHPPLNVPALALSLDQEVDLNKELVAHGYSNFVAGLFGTVPNYEVYINSVLFYRVGGGTRLAGLLLGFATIGLLLIGTAPIGYIPIMVVGALIFVLGIDLVKEALWDTRRRVSTTEYVTIVSIMVVMTVYDFVIGVLFGILISCVFFVVQSSRSQSIRALYTGEFATSSVRRPSAHRDYLREVAKQTTIVRLQGFLFFGTCTYVEETIRKLLDPASWNVNPIRFLIIDFSLVPGVDVSSAEALVRIQRLLASKECVLVLCGFKVDGPVGRSLTSVELLRKDNVELFDSMFDGLEWTENAYIRAYFMSLKSEREAPEIPISSSSSGPSPFHLGESFASSPRRSHIQRAATRSLSQERPIYQRLTTSTEYDPSEILSRAFSSYGALDKDLMKPLGPYLTCSVIPRGIVLWRVGDVPSSLYIIESGVLRATYRFPSGSFSESMVSGTLAGELSFLSDTPRNTEVIVEKQAVVWRLSREEMGRLERDNPEFAKFFVRLVLKAANLEHDALMASLNWRQ